MKDGMIGMMDVSKSIHHTLHICDSTVAWGRALGRITLLSVMHLFDGHVV